MQELVSFSSRTSFANLLLLQSWVSYPLSASHYPPAAGGYPQRL